MSTIDDALREVRSGLIREHIFTFVDGECSSLKAAISAVPLGQRITFLKCEFNSEDTHAIDMWEYVNRLCRNHRRRYLRAKAAGKIVGMPMKTVL
jgi:hypothetical protein